MFRTDLHSLVFIVFAGVWSKASKKNMKSREKRLLKTLNPVIKTFNTEYFKVERYRKPHTLLHRSTDLEPILYNFYMPPETAGFKAVMGPG